MQLTDGRAPAGGFARRSPFCRGRRREDVRVGLGRAEAGKSALIEALPQGLAAQWRLAEGGSYEAAPPGEGRATLEAGLPEEAVEQIAQGILAQAAPRART